MIVKKKKEAVRSTKKDWRVVVCGCGGAEAEQ